MATNLVITSKKLMQALNAAGDKITFGQKEFIGTEGKPHKMYSVNRAIWDEGKSKYINHELYSTTSMVRLVMYLRDMWYTKNGWDLPTDQELWNKLRKELPENGKYGT